MFETNPMDRIPQVDAMRAGIEYRLEISCRNFKLLVRPLTMSESVEVVTKVNDMLLKLPEAARTTLMESTLLAKETLKLATTTDYGTDDPTITDYVMDRMTPDELQYLHRQYVQAVDRVNPVLERLPKEELQGIVEEIKKNESALTALSFLQAVSVCRFLILGD